MADLAPTGNDHRAQWLVGTALNAPTNGVNVVKKPLRAYLEPVGQEGVILIKPGGTFNDETLFEIFRRVLNFGCDVLSMSVYAGQTIRERNLFEQQYPEPCRLAQGKSYLTAADYEQARAIYDCREFEAAFGVPYEDKLIIPAFELMSQWSIDEREITEVWEEARKTRFHTNRFNGLNKIGYQRSVLPCRFGNRVCLILNGYIPGYKALFEHPQHRVVALWVNSPLPWRDVRDRLVGGESSPDECLDGTIRKLARQGEIKVSGSTVDGQRNVAHSSANLIEGCREIMLWFRARLDETKIGRLLEGCVPVGSLDSFFDRPGDVFVKTRDAELQNILDALIKESWYRQTESEDRAVHYRSAIASIAATHALPLSLSEQNGELRARASAAAEFSLAGPSLFKNHCAIGLTDSKVKTRFGEAADAIIEHAKIGMPAIVLATEALKIAASDAYLIGSSSHFTREFLDLFWATLPAEALNTSRRLLSNASSDIRTKMGSPTEGADEGALPCVMAESPLWREFSAQALPTDDDQDLVGLILAGGRSTRVRSTVPKALLPVDDELIIDRVTKALRASGVERTYCAAGWRHELLGLALDGFDHERQLELLVYEHTPGLGFRLATCLEQLRGFCGHIVVTYCDMPFIAPADVSKLIAAVRHHDAIMGLLTCGSLTLSGNVVRDARQQVRRIVQSRLSPTTFAPERDFGVYVIRNCVAFREALLACSNDNSRREYVLADVIEQLVNRGHTVVDVAASEGIGFGVNTPSELVLAATGLHAFTRAGMDNKRIGQKVSNALKRRFNFSVGADAIARDVISVINARMEPPFFLWESG